MAESENKTEAQTQTHSITRLGLDIVNTFNGISMHRLFFSISLFGYIVIAYAGHMDQPQVERYIWFIVFLSVLGFTVWLTSFLVRICNTPVTTTSVQSSIEGPTILNAAFVEGGNPDEKPSTTL